MGLFERPEPETISVLDQPLKCQVCRHDKFWQKSARLHGSMASFFDVEWLVGSTATLVVCAQCGYVHWFLPE